MRGFLSKLSIPAIIHFWVISSRDDFIYLYFIYSSTQLLFFENISNGYIKQTPRVTGAVVALTLPTAPDATFMESKKINTFSYQWSNKE